MTYRPPPISVASLVDDIDTATRLASEAHNAALDLYVAAYAYGSEDTRSNRETYLKRRDALDVADTKLREHLGQMARSEQVAS